MARRGAAHCPRRARAHWLLLQQNEGGKFPGEYRGEHCPKLLAMRSALHTLHFRKLHASTMEAEEGKSGSDVALGAHHFQLRRSRLTLCTHSGAATATDHDCAASALLWAAPHRGCRRDVRPTRVTCACMCHMHKWPIRAALPDYCSSLTAPALQCRSAASYTRAEAGLAAD